jgi:MFS transporter, AAHS family, 4-hydroxybenzoate transporter
MRATGTGCALGAGRVGSVFGPMLGGIMLAHRWPPMSIYLVAGIPLVVAAVTTVCVRLTAAPLATQIVPALNKR